MMRTATGFVLISIRPAKAREVQKELSEIKEIAELRPLLSENAFEARLVAEDFTAMARVITFRIRTIPGVVDVKTLNGAP